VILGNAEETERRLRIVMVIDLFDSELNGGVISTRRFVEQLRKRHDVQVITTGTQGDGKVIVEPFRVPGFQRAIERQDMVLGWPQAKVLERTIAEADVVHIQFPLFLGMRAIKVAQARDKPVVSTFHVQPEHFLLNLGISSPFLAGRLHKFLIRKIYNQSAVVICPSSFAERELRQFGLRARSEVISNGVGLNFVTEREQIKRKDNGRFRVLTVGRLATEKRQHLLLEAVLQSTYKDRIEVTIVGRGPLESHLRKLGSKLPIEPRILSTGIPPGQLVSYYRESNLYVHTAGFEVEAMTVLEAMACGLPPLIANSPKSAASQFAGDERSLFLDDDAGDLCQKLDYWFGHPDELYAAALAHHAASAAYSLEASTRQLEAVYQSLV
jgi:glycosyltransferase involved in cell wall biosynthesis